MPPEIALYLGDRYIKITNFTWTGANGTQAMLASIASAIEHIDSRTCNEITTLRISCQNHNGCGECLRIVHLHFPRIGHIFVKDGGTHDYHVVPAIQLLSLPSQLGTTEGWLLPKLAKLDLCLRGSTSTDIGNRIVELVKRRKEAEEMVDITELRIKVGFGEIDPNAVEILSQSVTHFEFVSSS
ncbi:hypothetical protein FS837_001647 [Tulasnella sp. UAMH 9824]|nr:hypothetical protein FS837_001647 [Tulasnella sp. UAMH 9824]